MDHLHEWIHRLGWMFWFWVFALGSIVGSFLNVVVYRLPRGQSLAYPGSRCPACGHPIRWYHNLPIVSWAVLRGRCHDCGVKIAARYPLVELASAMLFVVLARIEVWAPSARLPPLSGQELVARWAYHVWLLETLLAAALIERDGLRVPRRLLCLALAIGLIGAAAMPSVQPGFARVTPAAWHLSGRWVAVIQAVAGGVAGLLAGWIYGLARKEVGRKPPESAAGSRPADGTYLAACVGVYLGWQAIVLGGLVATGICLLLERRTRRRDGKRESEAAGRGWGVSLLLASLGWLIAARLWIDFLPVWLP